MTVVRGALGLQARAVGQIREGMGLEKKQALKSGWFVFKSKICHLACIGQAHFSKS